MNINKLKNEVFDLVRTLALGEPMDSDVEDWDIEHFLKSVRMGLELIPLDSDLRRDNLRLRRRNKQIHDQKERLKKEMASLRAENRKLKSGPVAQR